MASTEIGSAVKIATTDTGPSVGPPRLSDGREVRKGLALLGCVLVLSALGLFRYLPARTQPQPQEPEPPAYKRRMALDTSGFHAVYDRQRRCLAASGGSPARARGSRLVVRHLGQ